MRRPKFEFPTEWSLCPEGVQDEAQQPTPEASADEESSSAAAETRVKPRVLAAGAFDPSSL
jgi:hypothetical protein